MRYVDLMNEQNSWGRNNNSCSPVKLGDCSHWALSIFNSLILPIILQLSHWRNIRHCWMFKNMTFHQSCGVFQRA